MRHLEEYELEHVLNSTGGFLFRLYCKLHLNQCDICRKRMKNLQEECNFAKRVKFGVDSFLSELEEPEDHLRNPE